MASFYQIGFELLKRVVPQATLFRYGFNWSPMYRRSTGRVKAVSKDLMQVEVQIRKSWKNVNYVNSIFGGAMLSATDPIMMIQLVQILGNDYVVWDKSVKMRFKRPARERIYVQFDFSTEELNQIKQTVAESGELDWVKTIELKSKDGTVLAVTEKTMYIASKTHYKAKRKQGRTE